MNKRYDVTVFGCAASVCILKVKELPCAGVSVWVDNPNAEVFNGGVGFNICCNLSNLGLRVYPVLTYPDERLGKLLHEDFSVRYDWPTDGLDPPMPGNYRTCYMFQDENRSHATVMYGYGEHADLTAPERPQPILDHYIDNSKLVVFASTRPINTQPVLRALQRHDVPYVFSYRNDAVIFPPDILKEILFGAHILFMNNHEEELLLRQYELKQITDLFSIGKAKVLTVTLGKQGSIVYSMDESGKIHQVHVPVTDNELGNVDAVGAGDAFLSGFLYGYINNKSLETCAQYGSTMSSFVIEKEGSTTNIPTIEMMLERNSTRPDARHD